MSTDNGLTINLSVLSTCGITKFDCLKAHSCTTCKNDGKQSTSEKCLRCIRCEDCGYERKEVKGDSPWLSTSLN